MRFDWKFHKRLHQLYVKQMKGNMVFILRQPVAIKKTIGKYSLYRNEYTDSFQMRVWFIYFFSTVTAIVPFTPFLSVTSMVVLPSFTPVILTSLSVTVAVAISLSDSFTV